MLTFYFYMMFFTALVVIGSMVFDPDREANWVGWSGINLAFNGILFTILWPVLWAYVLIHIVNGSY